MKANFDKSRIKQLCVLFATFFKIGLFTFGGGYAMLSMIYAEIVERRGWISKSELGDIFAIAESTPGPISINTATFIGYKRCGVLGGIVATLGVILPSLVIISALSFIIDLVKDNKWVNFIFKGIRIGVLVLIFKAVLTFYRDMRKNVLNFVLMAAGFALVFFAKADVIYIILGTIALCSVIVAATSAYRKRRYFIPTPEYYCARIGKPLEKDEYFSQKAVELGILKIKSADCAKSTFPSDAQGANGDEEDRV